MSEKYKYEEPMRDVVFFPQHIYLLDNEVNIKYIDLSSILSCCIYIKEVARILCELIALIPIG